MPPLALGLALTAAACHAGWNLLFKQSGDKDAFTGRLLWAAGVGLFPAWVYATGRGAGIPATAWPFVTASAVSEVCYYILLGAAYRRGALALVYPVARGTGALLTPVWAYLALGEHLSAAGAGGVALIAAGLFAMWRGHAGSRLDGDGGAFALAFASGIAISAYSVIDKAGVSRAPVVPYIAAMFLLTAALFDVYTRLATRTGPRARTELGMAVAVGLITALTYGMVLWAVTLAKVSYVAAVRESSMVFGILFGWTVLHERIGPRTLLGASMIVLGVTAIAVGG